MKPQEGSLPTLSARPHLSFMGCWDRSYDKAPPVRPPEGIDPHIWSRAASIGAFASHKPSTKDPRDRATEIRALARLLGDRPTSPARRACLTRGPCQISPPATRCSHVLLLRWLPLREDTPGFQVHRDRLRLPPVFCGDGSSYSPISRNMKCVEGTTGPEPEPAAGQRVESSSHGALQDVQTRFPLFAQRAPQGPDDTLRISRSP